MGRKAHAALALLLALAHGGIAQTRYTVQTENGVSWLRDSSGHRLFSFGVCVVDTGTKFEDYDPNNSGYAAWRFYKSKGDWASAALETLRSGGFNTVGAWSDYSSLLAAPGNDLKMTPILHNGSSAGFPWTDMWDPALVKVSDDVAKGLITSLKRDPRIIGYFSDNELGWWRAGLFQWVWKQPTHYTRHRAIAILKHLYHHSWIELTRAFDASNIKDWASLEKSGALFLRPGFAGLPAVSAIQTMLAKRYYSLCRSEIKRYDPGALYLGDRYISNYYPQVARMAGRYCDVVSTNLNPNWGDGGFVRYYLPELEKLTHKPILITEYYMSAIENASGNKNDSSGFPVVQNQAERTQGFLSTTSALLKTPYVVGAHWFQYYDEPKNGRGDGENYNFGLVSVDNSPYAALLEAGKSLDQAALHAEAKATEEAAFGQIPAYTGPSTSESAGDVTGWNRDQSFVPSTTSPTPRGDLYISWKPDGLELRLFWSEERFGEQYFRDGKVPPSDRTLLLIQNRSPHQFFPFFLSGETSSAPKLLKVKVDAASKLSLHLPAEAIGLSHLEPGQHIALRILLRSQNGSYVTGWKIDTTLANP